MPGCEQKGKHIRCRVKPPKNFDKRSLRWKNIPGGALIVGCPKRHFKNGRCNVGMQTQSRIYPATPGNKRKLLLRKKK